MEVVSWLVLGGEGWVDCNVLGIKLGCGDIDVEKVFFVLLGPMGESFFGEKGEGKGRGGERRGAERRGEEKREEGRKGELSLLVYQEFPIALSYHHLAPIIVVYVPISLLFPANVLYMSG